jgi:NADPH-dependent 2,4-dienoyl-CoA reductase/sulfur reductase-like enzyme
LATAKKGVIIGGGFIGLEFAECFKKMGMEVTIVDGSDYYWGNRLDQDSSQVLEKVLEANGIKVFAGELVEKFLPKAGDSSKVGAVVTKSGREFECDVVGIGIGIKSEFGWLEGSGLKIGSGIITNEYLETSLADVYSAGDCVQFFDVIIQAPHLVATWTNATIQGTVVGKTIAGQKTVFEAVSAYTTSFFGASVSFIGMTEHDFADEIIGRGSVKAGRMAQIFVKRYGLQTRIIGAIIINDFNEVAPITAAIKNRTDVSSNLQKLPDLNFDLHSFPIS